MCHGYQVVYALTTRSKAGVFFGFLLDNQTEFQKTFSRKL